MRKGQNGGFSKKDLVNALVIGFALFATFFGAGNLIFPPQLGLLSGENWLLCFVAYLLADAGLAVAAVLSSVRNGGGLESQVERLGKIPARVLCIALMLIVGPLLIVPRTGATSYEMSIKPLLPGMSPWIFSVLFFGAVALLTIKPAAVVDIIGKFLTPVLLVTLLVLCVKGIVSPLGTPVESIMGGSEIRSGLISGYQTMDALVALSLAVIVIKSVKDKGYQERKKQAGMISIACLVAFIGLLLVYAGLNYLGATVSGQDLIGLSGTELMVEITRQLLAQAGTILLGVIVLLACLTTAIGTASAAADYFSGVLKNKVPYSTLVLIICGCSVLLSNLGTTHIIALAEPVLSLLYPVFLTQVFLNFFTDKIRNRWVYRGAAIGAVLFAAAALIYSGIGVPWLSFLTSFPLQNLGLGWVLPAAAGGIIGAFIRTER
ncbi:MAG: branched-chain amino acid transport system II carrier protein [Lachnospiraceae bacterium]|nr:branched-chain amino acid transport system II carrier protein [Lachnospiraceae bacterium]